jgi:L-asparagine transporter-like permease
MASHLRFRKKFGCPPEGKCQMSGYPYTTIFVLISLIVAIASMPFVEGQTSGLIAGIVLVVFFEVSYTAMNHLRNRRGQTVFPAGRQPDMAAEFSEELTDTNSGKQKDG